MLPFLLRDKEFEAEGDADDLGDFAELKERFAVLFHRKSPRIVFRKFQKSIDLTPKGRFIIIVCQRLGSFASAY